MDDEWENISGDFCIPDYILVHDHGSVVKDCSHVPACPVIIFVNSRSGGQRGGDLLTTFRTLLNRNQVFDLGEAAPGEVLQQLYATLEILKQNGVHAASEIQKRLKLIVAGGDGTANWLLGVVSDLKLPHPPPVATAPLGTGNNLPFSFGWGKKNPGTDRKFAISFLNCVKAAKEMKIDGWHVIMRISASGESSYDPLAPCGKTNSLDVFRQVSQADKLYIDGSHTFCGRFWNYFSMGMDAQVSYAFHSNRKLHPDKYKNQNIAQPANIRIKRTHGRWEDLHIPRSIRSIVCLNLPSFSGGLNPWGKPDPRKSRERNLTPPYVDDGLFEIVGFRDAWHGLVLLVPKGHGTRLAQTNGVRFEFRKEVVDHTYMRIDGEPWKQPLPVDSGAVTVEISHSGQVKMLATPFCQAKSISNPLTLFHMENEKGGNKGDPMHTEEGKESKI